MDSCNIKVAIKARPLNIKEQLDSKVFWKVESDSLVHIDPISEKKIGEQFFFDRVFGGESTNYDVFDEIVKPIIDRGIQGFNGTVFAYGQTASGKTYTMSGDDSNPGIIPLAINYMFNVMNSSTSREYLLRACYLEIYNETVIDLLQKKNKSQTKKIEIQKDGLHITPLKAVVCQNAQMVIDLMKLGEKNRSIGETNMNERSSRSHTIFRIILESRNVDDDCDGAYQQSVINLVDLAGSERSNQTQSSMERFKEGCKINSSLTTLGLVIQQLSECPDSSQHINFRDSKLTRILQTSLGGNSLTAIICTVTLAVEDQTQYTLSFASRAKKIKNAAKVNENVTDETLLKRYRIQLSKLNKELEGMKQNQSENDEVNEIKYKYQEEKRTNEELKERIMRLQKNMITSSVGHKDQTSNKKGYQRRRTWGGKLDNTFSSNSILETIEEDVNMPRPSVPSNFGNLNKEFKTPLEPFEWDLIREEDRIVDNESLNNDNIENDFSPPSSIPFTVCETPKKVLRERVNNYKNMFEMSMKENNELREFTTLEKQMFYENNEQLKDLSCLKKQVDELQNEKCESAKLIEKLKRSVQLIENEKRDVEVSMEIQKNKYEKRETELLTTIEETRNELHFKTEQLKKAISNDIFMTEKQEEIKRLEIKIKEMNQLNNTYIDEIEMLKSQLLLKDQQLNEQSQKHGSLLDELVLLKSHVTEVKSIPYTIQYLAQNNIFTLEKNEIQDLDTLLEHIYNTVEQLSKENQSLKDENNNFKLITNNYTDQINKIEKENDGLRSQLNLIEGNIKSIIKDFSASSEIDVDNSNTDNLIDFAVRHFEKTTNEVDKLLNENTNLKDELSLTTHNFCEVKSFIFDHLNSILQSISSMDIQSDVCEDVEKFKKQLTETLNENVFLKSNIEAFNKITFECVNIFEQIKTNQSTIAHLQEELGVSNAIKNEFQVQINELDELNNNLKTLMECQAKSEEGIREELIIKSTELKNTLTKLDEMHLMIKENEVKFNSEIATIKLDLEAKSNLVVELEKTKLDLLTKYEEMEKYNQSNVGNLEQKEEIENQLRKEVEVNQSEIDKLNGLFESVKSELSEKINSLEKLNEVNNIKSSELMKQLEETNISKNEIHEELLLKTKELESTLSEVNILQLTLKEMKSKTDCCDSSVEKLNSELNTVKAELEEKSNIIQQFEKDILMKSNCNVDEISELNKEITKLKSELKGKTDIEDVLKSELHIVSKELDDATTKIIEVKLVIDTLDDKYKTNILTIEQLTNELLHNKSMLDEKINLIVELENSNSELLTKCENSDIADKLNMIITELEMKIAEKTQIENEIRNELQMKTTELENALIGQNEIQTLVVSMEDALQSYIAAMEQLKSELAIKSDLVVELENKNSETLLKYNEIDLAKKKDEICYANLQEELNNVLQEKALIQADLNVINQKYFEVSKHHQETKILSENALQLQVFNYQKLYTEFVNMSNDFESLLTLQIHTESILRQDILQKSAELEVLQKQLHESSLQQEYEKLEEEYMLRSRECDEAQEKIVTLESMLSSKEESEKVLINNYKSKCIALDDYKKNVEFLFSRNDSFQVRVNDFEENVLVNLDEEFDAMKSELVQKTEHIKTLMLEKTNLECNFNEIQDKLNNVTKELELSEERSEDLASIINVLVIEIKDANSIKENLEFRLNEAEHELLISGDIVQNLEYELCHVQKELENACIKTKTVEKDFYKLESKFNEIMNKKDLKDCDDRNQLIDPLVDYVHDIKLKLTELNSAMISGNHSEKQLRTKVMSAEEDILPFDDTWKINYGSQPNSPDVGIGLEIDNLRKILEGKIELINTLQKDKVDTEKNINELHEQMKKLSDENNKLIDDITSMKNDLKDKKSLVDNLTNELNKIKKDYSELEEHNQATKEQIHYSFDIDTELRNGKKNLVNEINLLEPGKISGVLTHHNLSTLLDTFVNLIMTKEQQIVTDLVNDHNKIKQQYEDQIKQFQEDIKKAKEWQEQVECDNEKLCLELENLKSEKHDFPSKVNEIKELKEKVLEAENQSFNYLSELHELKTQCSKMSEQNYQALSNELDALKISSEQTIQDLNKNYEDLTKKYNETMVLYKDQKNSLSSLEDQIEKVQLECTCLKTLIEEKDEAIKNLLDQVQMKTKEYETLIEKNSIQREKINETHEKKIDELQLELNDKTQEVYHKEKLLKEVTKNYNQLIEENASNVLKMNHGIQENNSAIHAKVAELERDIQTATELNKTKIENLETELKLKCTQLEETETKCSKLVNEIEIHKLKISAFEKQLEDCYQTLKLKDDEIENYQRKLKINNDNLVNVNDITDQLKKILNCSGTLSILYENISSLVANCESLKEENEELKLTNANLDSECESMLNELKFKEDKIVEFLTMEDELRHKNELLTEERDFLKNKCEQFKNASDDVKKLNEEICSYEQNIYQLRKEKGHLIVQHDKELKQLKNELKEVHSKNLELLNDFNKLSETAKNLEKSLKEDIQQLNRCIVDKNAKISTLELFSKTNTDELKKKNHELEHVFKRARDENHMLRKELRRFKEMMNTRKVDQCTQTIEEQSVVSGAMVAAHKSMTEKITKLENDNQVMKKMLHHRKAKIEELQKQLEERHS